MLSFMFLMLFIVNVYLISLVISPKNKVSSLNVKLLHVILDENQYFTSRQIAEN